tara:strand:+ start:35218 stop:35853 length:636 start_codon:yes stop_codon:yes gene_type:complete
MEPMLASVMIFAGNFAPRGWAFCDGQLLPISQNTALFSLLGTTYGGDGRTTFGLPDLRGRVAIGPRRGPGLSDYDLGQRGGQERHVLLINEMPTHSHTAIATAASAGGTASINATATLHADSTGATNDPTGNFLANSLTTSGDSVNTYGGVADVVMNTDAVTVEGTVDLGTIPAPTVTVGNTGGQQGHYNIQPFLAINYIIALTGYFPSRS